MKTKTFGYLVLCVALLGLGLWPVIYRFINTVNPLTLALYITAAGTVASFVVMLYRGTQKQFLGYFKNRTSLLVLITCSILVYTIVTLSFCYATHYIGADLVSLIYRSWPLLALLIAPIIMREHISRLELLGVTVAFAGVAFAILYGSGTPISVVATFPALIILLAAISDAVASLLQKRYSYELTSSIFAYNLVSFLILLPIALYFNAAYPAFSISTLTVISVFGVLQNVLQTFLFVTAYRGVRTSIASNAFMLVPFLTMLFGFFILGEPVVLSYVIIAVSVGVGFAVASLRPKKQSSYIISSKRKTEVLLPTIYDVTSAFVSTRSNTILDAMQSNGRVLAFYKKVGSTTEMKGSLDTIKSINAAAVYGDCFLFTNVDPVTGVSSPELEYVQDIVGHEDDDLLVFGVGHPKVVEDAFGELHKTFIENHKR
jgi:drug/metabolite transporter (DMT)-like permease